MTRRTRILIIAAVTLLGILFPLKWSLRAVIEHLDRPSPPPTPVVRPTPWENNVGRSDRARLPLKTDGGFGQASVIDFGRGIGQQLYNREGMLLEGAGEARRAADLFGLYSR